MACTLLRTAVARYVVDPKGAAHRVSPVAFSLGWARLARMPCLEKALVVPSAELAIKDIVMTVGPVARVWIYESGVWRLDDDPTGRREEDAVWVNQKDAGYELSMRLQDGNGTQHLEMWTRPGAAPECQIIVAGEFGKSHVVYVARLPEGFDLMAKWEPLVTKFATS